MWAVLMMDGSNDEHFYGFCIEPKSKQDYLYQGEALNVPTAF